MRVVQPYDVIFRVELLRTYRVDAVSPEEAENVASEYMDAGEAPADEEILDLVVEDVLPTDPEPSDMRDSA